MSFRVKAHACSSLRFALRIMKNTYEVYVTDRNKSAYLKKRAYLTG